MDMFEGLAHAHDCFMEIRQRRAERHARRREDAINRIRKCIEDGVKDESAFNKVHFNANIWNADELPTTDLNEWKAALEAKGYEVSIQMDYRQPVVGHGGRGEPCHVMRISWSETKPSAI